MTRFRALLVFLLAFFTVAGAARAWISPLSDGEAPAWPELDPKVPNPEKFLGYPLGQRFTHWDKVIGYLQAVAAASDRVKIRDYGTTYEGRPLKLLALSAPENLARLETLRTEHLRLADPGRSTPAERERAAAEQPAVVWLAYGIHGNESSSTEAAMALVYLLAAGQGEIPGLLGRLVVLIDPLSNPDGRERYVSAYEQRAGAVPDPRPAAAEHAEPWPGGRQNHYLIDLNRDWAWASQQETRQRIAAYREWEPQVYADFHEMGAESSYFFPPPAEPVHPKIDRRVLSWLDRFGRANAQAFDERGWIYFKGESYDLFYPGYGDSYPSLRGAVGMTYEMAGGGRAGLALRLPDGSTLTLADRLVRHLTTSLTTLRTAAAHREPLLRDFMADRLRPSSAPVRTFLWSADRQEARSLAELLALHGIAVQQLSEPARLKARRLERGSKTEEARTFPAGTYLVSTAQPLGVLAEALLDLDTPMSAAFLDRQRERLEQNRRAEFYDITAWSLPLAFNLEAWTGGETPGKLVPLSPPSGRIEGLPRLGVLVRPQGLATWRLAAKLQERSLRFRVALRSFQDFPSGTLFIPRNGNPPDLPEVLSGLLATEGLTAQGLDSSYELGLSPGSRDMAAVRPVRIALLSGEGVDATSFGFLWHLLDRQLGFPIARIDLAHFDRVDLRDFQVLLMPDGDYEARLPEADRTKLEAWIRAGGQLVAVGDAIGWLQKHELTGVKSWEAPKPTDEEVEEESLPERPVFTPGAALATRIAPSHPLTLGLEAPPAVLVEGTLVLLPTGDPRQDVVLARPENPVVAGFTFPEAEERLAGSLLVSAEPRGKGRVVLFAQNPAFRLFWRGTLPVLLNALLYGPSLDL